MIELQGWITHVGGECNGEPDFHVDMAVDSKWAADQSIDLNGLFQIGNILDMHANVDPGSTPFAMVATPLIHMEVWGFSRAQHPDAKAPTWSTEDQFSPPAKLGAACPGVLWPYNPQHPVASDQSLRPGQYVRVVGSLISDNAHVSDVCKSILHPFPCLNNAAAFLCANDGILCDFNGDDTAKRAAYRIWGEKVARWTELHPPDLIEVLHPVTEGPHPAGVAPSETFRAVALVADNCLVGTCPAAEVNTDILPGGTKPRHAAVGFVELVSHIPGETNFRTIEIGNAQHDGAQITVLPDRIHVRIRVRGQSGEGAPGKFKALYRVFWREVKPAPITSP